MSEPEPLTKSRPQLTVISGGAVDNAPAPRIALSLVHARERIDIPVSAVLRIEAGEEFTVCDWGTRRLWTILGQLLCTPGISATTT